MAIKCDAKGSRVPGIIRYRVRLGRVIGVRRAPVQFPVGNCRQTDREKVNFLVRIFSGTSTRRGTENFVFSLPQTYSKLQSCCYDLCSLFLLFSSVAWPNYLLYHWAWALLAVGMLPEIVKL